MQEKDEKSFPTLRNLIKTEEKKYSPINIKTTRHCDFNTLDLQVDIQSSWIMLRNSCLKTDSYMKGTSIILHYMHPVNSQLRLKKKNYVLKNRTKGFTSFFFFPFFIGKFCSHWDLNLEPLTNPPHPFTTWQAWRAPKA